MIGLGVHVEVQGRVSELPPAGRLMLDDALECLGLPTGPFSSASVDELTEGQWGRVGGSWLFGPGPEGVVDDRAVGAVLDLAHGFDVFRTGVNDLLMGAVTGEVNAAIAEGKAVTLGAMTAAMEPLAAGQTLLVESRAARVAREVNEFLRLLTVREEFAQAVDAVEFDLDDAERAVVADDVAAVKVELEAVRAELVEMAAAAKVTVEGLSAVEAVRPLLVGLREALAGSPAVEGYGATFFLDELPASETAVAAVRVRRVAAAARERARWRESKGR